MASGSHTRNVQSTVASGSAGVANIAKKGRGMKTDPAWEHGDWVDEATTKVKCNYCERVFTGGAHRLKHHLAGTSRDIKACKVVPANVKKIMEDIINGFRKKMLKNLGIDIEDDVAEAEVDANSNGKRESVGKAEVDDIEDDVHGKAEDDDIEDVVHGKAEVDDIEDDVHGKAEVDDVAHNDMFKRVEDSDSMASKTESESPTDTPPSPPKNVYKDPDDGRQRFLLEMEFVQCLANPTYIHYLAQNRYFEDEAFIGYLKYLQYWQRPEYIKFIMYPHCLHFLELFQSASFRSAMAHPTNKELAHRQQFYFWKNYRNNRLKHILPRPLPEPAAALAASSSTQPQPPVPALPPPPPPPAATNVAATTSSTQAPSPMPYGSGSAKNDTRNPTVDRRKRK